MISLIKYLNVRVCVDGVKALKMEDSKLGKFKLGTKKMIGRTNEKFKQKIGRSSENVVSKDDKFQVIVSNFNRQQVCSIKFFP